MNVTDLSQRLDWDTPVYPGDAPVALDRCRTLGQDGYNTCLLRSGLHAATHVDMPSHMTEDTCCAADFPPSLFFGSGVLLDVRGEERIRLKPSYRKLDLRNRIVLLWTGFDSFYRSPEYFTGHPAVEPDFARFLLKGGIKMLGIDAPSPDRHPFPVHTELLGNGVFLLENLTNLAAISGAESFIVSALPLKVVAEAGFTRAVAIWE